MQSPTPPGDPGRPANARIYSFLHGGTDWYAPDRDLALTLESIYPGVRRMAAGNRTWLQHAVLYATAHLGISQFLDLGCGFPDAGSVRAHAQAADPGAAVACVDSDELVAGPDGYGAVLDEQGVKGVSVVLADIRDPAAVLADPGVTGVIDLARPAMAVFGLVLHCMPADQARRVVAGFTAGLAPGSCVAVTVVRNDDEAAAGPVRRAWEEGTRARFSNFTPDQVRGLFGGCEILPPGVGPVAGRRPGWESPGFPPGSSYVLGGIGIKR